MADETDDDLLNELRALGEQRPQDAPEADAGEALPAYEPAGPRIDMLSGGPNPGQFGRDLLIDNLVIQHAVERANAERDARDQSSAGLFGDWGKLDEKGKKEWAQGEKDYAQIRLPTLKRRPTL